ncbi:MAG: ABC transporter ATP-binding protein [Planctomycetes bacterium]|nr:ABC transporter ATP-binding protein [Planctomycetota bacterium]
MPPSSARAIQLQGLTKRFGETTAVDAVDLEITDNELFFLLGPSGCGKTTLLRMIAGFIEPTGGRILLGDRDVTAVPPNKRNTGMVFQSYALWPHMTVADNVGYGLKIRKIAADERARRVTAALETVQMEALAGRKPNQLSGGQQQRVALARALVVEPSVLLLDEPLSNLDAKLRLSMRAEIRRICKGAGITTVYVTHDQKEALSMADRVAVLDRGQVVQVGGPRELYERPSTRFVADFLGETNFLPAVVKGRDNGAVVLQTPAGILRSTSAPPEVEGGRAVLCSLRPEAVRIGGPADGNRLAGSMVSSSYLGEVAQHVVALPGDLEVVTLELNPRPFGPPGSEIALTVDPDQVVVLAE